MLKRGCESGCGVLGCGAVAASASRRADGAQATGTHGAQESVTTGALVIAMTGAPASVSHGAQVTGSGGVEGCTI